MSEFSIKEAALTGFRFGREHPTTILVWTVLSLIAALASNAITVTLAGEALAQMQAMSADPTTVDPSVMMAITGQVLSASAIAMLPLILVSTLLTAAATRAILTPQSGGLGFLRLGVDEFRILIVLIVVGVILGLVYMAGTIVMGIGVGVVAIAGGTPPQPGVMTAQMAAVMGPTLFITGLLMLYVYGRFSLAAPLTLDRRAINIFSSVSMTKGLGGRLFRTYLLAGALYAVVGVLGVCIAAGVAAALTGDVSKVVDLYTKPDMSSLGAYYTPLRIATAAVMAVISALGAAIMLTPPITVYKTLTQDGVDEIF